MVVNRPLLTELLQLLFAHFVQKLPFSCDEESIVENDRYYYPRWWRKEERDDPLERRILLATNKVLREQSHDGGKGNSWAWKGEGRRGSPCTRVRQNIVRSAGRDVSRGGERG